MPQKPAHRNPLCFQRKCVASDPMRPRTLAIVAGGASAAAAALVILKKRSRMAPLIPRDELTRWRVVTVLRTHDEIAPDGVFPEPLASLGSAVETKLTVAPGGRGTELWARLRDHESDLTADDVRKALRRSKQLVESGEIAVVHPVSHGRRRTTPQGVALDVIAAVSEGKGIL